MPSAGSEGAALANGVHRNGCERVAEPMQVKPLVSDVVGEGGNFAETTLGLQSSHSARRPVDGAVPGNRRNTH